MIEDFLQKHGLKIAKAVVAVSGGPDSMALLDMLRQSTLPIVVAHVDHNLRADSAKESELLTKYCQRFAIPLFETKWESHPDHGLEASARDFRYRFFADVIEKQGASYLITAHHGDDLLENILIKLIRSGNPYEMNSLAEVQQRSSYTLLRPLLTKKKAELVAYCQDHQIAYLEDSTNFEDETLRNRLRHNVIPLLKQENPKVVEHAYHFHEKLDLFEDGIADLVKRLTVEHYNGGFAIAKKDLIGLPQKLIFDYLANGNNYQTKEFQDKLFAFVKIPKAVSPFKVELDQAFIFQNGHYMITRTASEEVIGQFYANSDDFEVGSLLAGKRLLSKSGQHILPKKKFQVPKALRPGCLTVYEHEQVVFVENCYANQQKGKELFYIIRLR
ncbi:MAG: tRNA lysidine(34) synthetase TilS [Lactobacillus sp.]|nr:tRNA lysidine(34) synthetase TilS [Lactobacillus sp.]